MQFDFQALGNDSECESDSFIPTYHQGSTAQHLDEGQMNDDIFIKQQQLKDDAKLALAIGTQMARMQVEIERQVLDKKRAALYDFIGINTDVTKPLSIKTLEGMNLGQLQMIVNDLYCQIEANNDQLINFLIERDSLSMEQDSILVDIEDCTRRIEERANDRYKPIVEYVYLLQPPPKRTFFQKLFAKKFPWK